MYGTDCAELLLGIGVQMGCALMMGAYVFCQRGKLEEGRLHDRFTSVRSAYNRSALV